MKTFTLSLSKWLRAPLPAVSQLYYGRKGLQCCLGMFGEQCGIPLIKMDGRPTPDSIDPSDVAGDFLLLLTPSGLNSDLAKQAMQINDNPATTDDQKIALLRPIFAELGYEIEVVP